MSSEDYARNVTHELLGALGFRSKLLGTRYELYPAGRDSWPAFQAGMAEVGWKKAGGVHGYGVGMPFLDGPAYFGHPALPDHTLQAFRTMGDALVVKMTRKVTDGILLSPLLKRPSG